MKILVDENIPYAKELFSRLGEVQVIPGRNISASTLTNIDALIIRSVTKVDSTLLDNSRVTFVGTTTAGTDHIDIDWLAKSGISFCSAPGCNAIAVVEYVISALLWLAQRDGFTLHNRIVGIVGSGNIGSLLQQRLNILGVNTLLCDPPLAEAGVSGNWQSLEKLVTEADVLTFHTPLIISGCHTTWHLADKELLAALPNKSIIINTSRGSVIDNTALLHVLDQGKLISTVIDVWEQEPKLSLPLLAKVDIGTAHIAGYTLEGKIRGTAQIFNAYSTFIGSDVQVNLAELLTPPIIEYIKIHGEINEEILRSLVHLIYDVRRDDMQLRLVANRVGEFDRLRKQYYQRREWSSLCVESDNNISMDTLHKLGFQVS